MLIMPYTREQFIAEVDRRCDRDTGLGAIWDAEVAHRATLAVNKDSRFMTGLDWRCQQAVDKGLRDPDNFPVVMHKLWLPPTPDKGIYSEVVKARAPELWQRSRVVRTKVHLRGPVPEVAEWKQSGNIFADMERKKRWDDRENRLYRERREAVKAIRAELGIEGVYVTDDAVGWVFGTVDSEVFDAKVFTEIVGDEEAERFVTPRPKRLGPIPPRKCYYAPGRAPEDEDDDSDDSAMGTAYMRRLRRGGV